MKRRYRRKLVTLSAAALAAGALAIGAADHTQWPLSPAPPAAPAPPPTAAAGDIARLLAQIPTATTITPVAGYDRSCKKGHSCVFGPAWNDPLDHSGCDTRSRVLAAQLHDVQFKPGTRTCKVTAGWVHDPYTGQRITLEDIAVDHVVALRYAWDAGAWQWTPQQRAIFANDTDNLLAVDTRENSAKGDSGPSEWLPATGQCAYVIRFLSVAAKYQLAIADADRHAAMIACPAGVAS
ncbi:HNH endonuclease [Mycolicibacterium novocastrense]|uniref:HNH endonuclease n=1 Tax=Mycolicibacterium novocastrense TaxID=59813 RepID=A0AAW5SHK9_MYCNV|nr:HNH endonuclease family protein [Mycolicibacterium novocastrense]MCV7023635.1 HNH endonuclease [Mycolicibacterium novocastrense]GAT07721.1 uncharacterized protein RMCN_0854 [Mycolicibacterium novocastrense]